MQRYIAQRTQNAYCNQGYLYKKNKTKEKEQGICDLQHFPVLTPF